MGMEVKGQGINQALNSHTGPAKTGKKEFLENFKMLPEARFRETPSGLKIAVMKEGKGDPVKNGMRVRVNYTGWLKDGTKFDSTVDKGKPFEFEIGAGNVIKGWEEGLLGMKPGERRQLVIPANLAYGNSKSGKIPPGSILIFNIEAVGIMTSPNHKGNLSISA